MHSNCKRVAACARVVGRAQTVPLQGASCAEAAGTPPRVQLRQQTWPGLSNRCSLAPLTMMYRIKYVKYVPVSSLK